MTLSPELKAAFRWHMRGIALPLRLVNALPRPRAIVALERARQDVAAGKRRYSYGPSRPVKQSDGMTYLENPESFGLRYIGRVIADCGRNGIWDSRDSSGWYTDPYGDTFRDGTGLCWGVVYQLPGRNGESRFVAGYQFGGCDDGSTLDLSRIYTESKYERWGSDTSPANMDSARDAARAADSMAQHAAEEEREYQTACHAGSRYSDESDQLAAAREELKSILAERRKVKGQAAYPALCKAIRARVSDLLESMRESRDNMRELAQGDNSDLVFWSGDKRLQDAFCEGSGLDKFPA